VRTPERIEAAYQWEAVVAKYEELFERLSTGYYRTTQSSD
jgi:hypothetical protein